MKLVTKVAIVTVVLGVGSAILVPALISDKEDADMALDTIDIVMQIEAPMVDTMSMDTTIMFMDTVITDSVSE